MEELIELKKILSERELAVLNSELEKRKKSTALAYLLWFIVGMLGVHKFYLGKIGIGILYLVLGVIGWGSVVSGLVSALQETAARHPEALKTFTEVMALAVIGAICLLLLSVLLIIDLFTIPRQVRKRNDQLELSLIRRIMGAGPGGTMHGAR